MQAAAAGLSPSLKVDHVTLLLGSIEASMPFYEALLPLLGFQSPKSGIWHDGDGFYLQFREAEPGSRPYERYGAGMNHLGFAAPSPDFVAHVRARMQEKGFDVPDVQQIGPATALFMKDPDGIRFEISYVPQGVPPVD